METTEKIVEAYVRYVKGSRDRAGDLKPTTRPTDPTSHAIARESGDKAGVSA
jgi:hypothetical protein